MLSQDNLLKALKFTAITTSGMFAGMAAFITTVDVPTRRENGTAHSITHFPGMFFRSAAIQSVLQIAGTAAAFGAYKHAANQEEAKFWLTGTVVYGLIMPYTLIFIKPVFTKLLDKNIDKQSPATAALLDKWANLHAVRTVVGTGIFALFLYHSL